VGGTHWGGADDDTSIAAIHRALDAGVTLFDTAPVYGFGHSESVLGRALAGREERIVVASKCGLTWDDRGRIRHDNRPERVRFELDESLKRLGTDRIDLYQIHWPDPDVPIEDTVGELARLRDAGKVRWLGVSNFDASQLRRALAVTDIVSNQVPYHLLRRDIETELLPACDALGVGVLAYEPLCRGLFTGKFDASSRFKKRDLRRRDERFQGDAFAANVAVVDALEAVAEGLDLTVAQLAVQWVLADDRVTSALCGARSAEQISETLQAGAGALDAELRTRVEAALDSLTQDTVGGDPSSGSG